MQKLWQAGHSRLYVVARLLGTRLLLSLAARMGCGASQNAAVAPDEPSAGNTAVAQYSPVKGPPTPQRGGPVLTLSKHLTEDEESRVASAHLRSITFEKANVNVAVRIRPLSAAEAAKGGEVSVEPMSPQSLTVMPLATGLSGGPAGGGGRTSDFAFDSVFPADATQNQVYRHGARAILTKVLEGYNGCIFAYGQTGSGKTHTMEGTREDPGVIPRLCEDVFSTIARQRADRTYCVTVSYLEVYNETLKDLLSDVKGSVAIGGAGASASGAGSDAGDSGVAKESGASRGPMIREDPSTGVFVENAACIAVSSYDQVEALLHSGTRRRAKGETRMNAVSSRSHAVLTMEVEQRDSSDFTGLTRMVAKLHLVDLVRSTAVRHTRTARLLTTVPAAAGWVRAPEHRRHPRREAAGGRPHQPVAVGSRQRHQRLDRAQSGAHPLPRQQADTPAAG